jgi:transcription antitermination factor NusG
VTVLDVPDQSSSSDCDPLTSESMLPWYAIRTRSNQERVAVDVLKGKGYEPYVPLYQVRRRRPDRSVTVDLPLFPGYVFCRFNHGHRLPILTTPGVVSVVGFGSDPAPIPDEEIQAVRAALMFGLAAAPHPFLREGQRVRVTHGPMKGVEGIVVKMKADWRLVVSIQLLQRSVSVEFDSDHISVA